MHRYIHPIIFLVVFFVCGFGFFLFSHSAHATAVNCAGGCNGWWVMEHNGGPGMLGGIETQITAEPIHAADATATFGYYLFLVDHGPGRPQCLSGSHSVYVYTGLENNNTQTGEYPMWGDCRANQSIYTHMGSWLPSSDYGKPFTLSISQYNINDEWQVQDFDSSYGVDDYWYSIENAMQPYAWRYGAVLYDDNSPSTMGTTTVFTLNRWCPYNNFDGICSFQYYNGASDTINNAAPLVAKWDQIPECSATGGTLELDVTQ